MQKIVNSNLSTDDQLFLRKLIFAQFSVGYTYFGLTCFLLVPPLYYYWDSGSVSLIMVGVISGSWIVNYFLAKKEKKRFERNSDHFFSTEVESHKVEGKITKVTVQEVFEFEGAKSIKYHHSIESSVGVISFSSSEDPLNAGDSITFHGVRITCFEKEAFNYKLFAFKRDGIYLEELIELIPHPAEPPDSPPV